MDGETRTTLLRTDTPAATTSAVLFSVAILLRAASRPGAAIRRRRWRSAEQALAGDGAELKKRVSLSSGGAGAADGHVYEQRALYPFVVAMMRGSGVIDRDLRFGMVVRRRMSTARS